MSNSRASFFLPLSTPFLLLSVLLTIFQMVIRT